EPPAAPASGLLHPAAARPTAHSAAMKNCLYIIPPRSEASTLWWRASTAVPARPVSDHAADVHWRAWVALALADTGEVANTRPSNRRRAVRTTLATTGASSALRLRPTSRAPLGCSRVMLPGSGRHPTKVWTNVPGVTAAVAMPTAPVMASAVWHWCG